MSAVEWAGRIARREVSVESVVDSFIKAQESVNPSLNALVENRWEAAREEARAKDKELLALADDEIPPLFGVPVTIKEMISVAGMKQTLGSIHRQEFRQNFDATVVKRLKDGGAIVLGTTNIPELGFWFECENPVYGWTRNPYDLKRTSGGSSGGEAALLGAGASALGLGSDVGGSIRIPAHFCGVFGHKPSLRIVPLTGHFPVNVNEAHLFKPPRYPLTTIGPLGISAKDLRAALELLIGPDGLDPEVRTDFKLQAPVEDWSGRQVWVLSDPVMSGVTRCNPEIIEAVEISAQYFESLGCTVRRMRSNYLKDAANLWAAALSEVEGKTFEEVLFSTAPPSLLKETLRSLLNENINYTFPALVTVAVERLMAQTEMGRKNSEQRKALESLRYRLSRILGNGDLLICPVHPRVAPYHRGTFTRPFDFAMAAIFNALGFPVTVAPVTQHEGLPIGVQLVSAWGLDHVTLSAAEALESAFGGWKPPSGFAMVSPFHSYATHRASKRR